MSSVEWLQPLYSLISRFLDALVSPKMLMSVMNEYNISRFADLVDNSFVGEWRTWSAKYFLGFVTVICLGLIFAVALPFAYCCFVCGSRRCYGSYYDLRDRKGLTLIPARRTYGCTVALSSCSTVMLAMVVVAYIVIVATTAQLGPDGLLAEWRQQAEAVDNYLVSTLNDANTELVEGSRQTKSYVLSKLSGLPAYTRRRLEENVRIEKPLTQLQELAREMPLLSQSLNKIQLASERLKKLAEPLSRVLKQCRERLVKLLPTCEQTNTKGLNATTHRSRLPIYCSSVMWNVTINAKEAMSYTNALTLLPLLTLNSNYLDCDDVTKARQMADLAVRKNFKGLVNNAIRAYEIWKVKWSEATEPSIRRIKENMNKMNEKITNAFTLMNRSVMTVRVGDRPFASYERYIDTFQKYYTYIYIPLTTVMLVLIISHIVIVVIVISRKAAKKISFCRRLAANALAVSVFIMLCLSVLLVGATVALLAVGGATYIVACRPMVTRDETLERYVDLAKREAGVTYEVKFTDVLRRCRSNASLYMAFDVEHNTEFKLSKILSLHDVDYAVKQLGDFTGGLEDFQLFRSTSWIIAKAIAMKFKLIDFDEYLKVSSSNVTKISLAHYVGLLDKVSAGMSNLALADELSQEAKHLRDVNADRVYTMQRYHAKLLNAVTKSRNILRIPLSAIMLNIVLSQRVIIERGNDIVRTATANVTTDVLRVIEHFKNDVTHGVRDVIGCCRPLYDAWDAMVTGTCFRLVAPLNVVWFCNSVFLCVSLPAAMIAFCIFHMM